MEKRKEKENMLLKSYNISYREDVIGRQLMKGKSMTVSFAL